MSGIELAFLDFEKQFSFFSTLFFSDTLFFGTKESKIYFQNYF